MTADRWKNRRRMAWLALLAGLAFPVLLLYTDSQQLGAVAGAFYAFAGAVVAAYIGFASWDDKNFKDVSTKETQ
jgi:di/tricarboxylate transporter